MELSKQTNYILEIKQILGYSQTKTIVSCGYNSTKAQQHEAIIKNILMLDPEIINKIQFIFPMTYGDKFYKESIKNILSKTITDTPSSSSISLFSPSPAVSSGSIFPPGNSHLPAR